MYIEEIKNIIWGMPTVFLISAVGIYFTVKSGWFPITGIKEILRSTLGSLWGKNRDKRKNSVTSFMAVATAIGGTVGVGSIIGVGYAITSGGAGSLFWMWISGFFGMMIKYAEVYIAVKYRKKKSDGYAGGAMYCLWDFGYKRLGVLFALLCIFASIGVGNLTQTNAVSHVLQDTGIPLTFTGFILCFLFALIILGGQRKIARISAFVVPAVSLIYLICSFYILLRFLPEIPDVFRRIFSEALGYKAALGGFSGTMISQSIRVGFARGVFSNEAGMGSSPIAHAAAENCTPHTQGMWGITEIIIDTFVVTTLSGLTLLCAVANGASELFELCFGRVGIHLLGVLLTVFALASMISWCFYSEVCILFLTQKKVYLTVYRLISIAATFFGALMSVTVIWDIADIFNGLMIFPNMFLLIIKNNDITNRRKNI
ncbi:MAG: amino acid carrier protein [Eubacteriales bacterium]|nr:amino acid carrier protein [Eubacteriales bacterium]